MMRLSVLLRLTVLLALSCYSSWGQAYDFFSQAMPDNTVNLDVNLENKDLNQEQKHLAEQHDQEENNYKVLKNLFYANERISIYNYTVYNMDDLKSKMIKGAPDAVGLHDLSISFGYGMSYRLKDDTKLGYEYVSNFPYDRGQLIRFFWIRSF